MKKLGYMILHYGLPYLEASIQAILPQVDKLLILYTAKPSQGYITDLPCPDTQEELWNCAKAFKKILWVEGEWGNEGAHVSTVWKFADGYDWLVRLDSDEIYPAGMVDAMIAQAMETDHKDYRIPFLHHWRTFGLVCRDAHMPTRLTRVVGGEGERYLESQGKWWVNHMGYAMPTRYIEYKLKVSGHHDEFRKDWLEERWKANALLDVHPVIFKWWNPEPYDLNLLPESLKHHRFYGVEVIE